MRVARTAPARKLRRARPGVLAACAVLATAVVGHATAAADESILTGMNVTNPQWLAPARREAIFDQVQRAGVRVVRIPFLPPTGGNDDGAIEILRGLGARGIKVLLILYLEYPPGTPIRPAVASLPDMWPGPALSAADPARFRTRYLEVFRKLDAAGITLAGIELGNEINWTAFNGEFPIPGQGRVFNLDDLRTDPQARRIAAGFRAYVRTAAELKRIRDGSMLNSRTPIISAGLADLGPSGPSPLPKLDAVSIPATLRFLREHGIDDLVDAYGVHTYPPIEASAAKRLSELRSNVLSECRAPDEGKPCWLTEWGFPSKDVRCPPQDASRAALVAEMAGHFRTFAREGRLRATVYYQWAGDEDPLGVYRCGALTPSGELAISPAPAAAR